MNILLGLTGSVATKIAPKIIEALESVPRCTEVRVIMTDKARMFYEPGMLSRKAGVEVYVEQDEWQWEVKEEAPNSGATYMTSKWEKGLPILHIELAKWADVLVIAPLTANTLAKMANGICDNLLTSVVAAWNTRKPLVIAPAMNTRMWSSPATTRNIDTVWHGNGGAVRLIPPVEKTLACGDVGIGALADVSDIAKGVEESMRWGFPISTMQCRGIPVGKHPGAFAAVRKHDCHCGVDLYCNEGTVVMTVEQGKVVSIEDFTGKAADCPWWLDTKAVKVEGASGVVCYGEILPAEDLKVGAEVSKHELIGSVVPVLRPGKERPDIPGHSRCMLHLQVYAHGTLHGQACGDKEVPSNVIDPTPFLLETKEASVVGTLDMP